MKFLKKLIAQFTPLELIVLMVSLTVSSFIIAPVVFPAEVAKPLEERTLFPSVAPYNTLGDKVDVFDTLFYIQYEGSSESETVFNEIIDVMNEYLVPYHKLFDRHNDYFAVLPVDESAPSVHERETLPLIHNLKYINDHKNEEIEIDEVLYNLLYTSHQYSLNTPENAFNMFIGGVYDFWEPHLQGKDKNNDPLLNEERRLLLEELVDYIPLSKVDIENALTFRVSEDKHYITFNDVDNVGEDLSISVGATGKGLMTDILEEALLTRGLTAGYINGGRSSVTLLEDGFGGKELPISLGSIRNNFASTYKFVRHGKFRMATSGTYEGFRFTHNEQEILRSHIIDPQTGYPASHSHLAVNITSNTLTGLELDYLTTSLLVLNESDGRAFIKEKFMEHDLNIAYAGRDSDGTWFVHTSQGYPGGNNSRFEVFSPFLYSTFEL